MSDRLLHLFFAQSPISLSAPDGSVQADDEPKIDFWKVVFRTGEWKLRPGPGGVKLKEPLRIYRDKAPKGHLSMSTIKSSFEGDDKGPAKENVTMPTVHADGTVTDSGFIRKLVIQDVMADDGKTVKESLLWAGCEVTDSQTKTRVKEKSLVGCSAGVLFDYERTEDGKKFDQILSHVMFTNSPWINGCGGFLDKLPEGVMASEDREIPQEEVSLDAGTVLPPIDDDPPKDKPKDGTVVWRPDEGFQNMRGKVQRALKNWRRTILASLPRDSYSYDDFPYLSAEDVSYDGTTRKALITSGYGDEKECWVATFSLDEDKDVIVEPFQNWTEATQEWVAASEEQEITKPAPSAVRTTAVAPVAVELSELRRAQMARAERLGSPTSTTPTHTGGSKMSKLSELLKGVDLSDEQRAGIAEEEARTARLEEKARLDREAAKEAAAKSFLSEMDEMGLGDNDSPGLRVKVRDYFLSDDGEYAIELSETTSSGKRTAGVGMTATEIVKDLVGALPRNADGKVSLSEQARKLPGDSKPEDGNAAPGGEQKDQRSPKEKADALLSEGDMASMLGIPAPVAGGKN